MCCWMEMMMSDNGRLASEVQSEEEAAGHAGSYVQAQLPSEYVSTEKKKKKKKTQQLRRKKKKQNTYDNNTAADNPILICFFFPPTSSAN